MHEVYVSPIGSGWLCKALMALDFPLVVRIGANDYKRKQMPLCRHLTRQAPSPFQTLRPRSSLVTEGLYLRCRFVDILLSSSGPSDWAAHDFVGSYSWSWGFIAGRRLPRRRGFGKTVADLISLVSSSVHRCLHCFLWWFDIGALILVLCGGTVLVYISCILI